jgi:hypothetical protein
MLPLPGGSGGHLDLTDLGRLYSSFLNPLNSKITALKIRLKGQFSRRQLFMLTRERQSRFSNNRDRRYII